MKTFNFLLKKLSIAVIAILPLSINAQTLVIENVTPGTLLEAYNNAGGSFWNYTETIIKGQLNKSDLGMIKSNTHLMCDDFIFDMSEVTFVDDEGVPTNEMYEEAFNGVQPNTLVTFVLPESITRTAHKSFAGFEGKLVAPGLEYIANQCFAWNRKAGSLELYPNVKEIATNGFGWCDKNGDKPGLTDITIGDKIEIIHPSAFNDCDNLKEVTIKATTPPTFTNLGGNVGSQYVENFKPTLYVPTTSVDAYKAIEAFNNSFAEIKPIIANSISEESQSEITAYFNNDNLVVNNVNKGDIITITDSQGRVISRACANENSWNKTINTKGILFINICQPSKLPVNLKMIR